MKKYSLPKEFAEKWVEALRSGEYRQAKGLMITFSNGNKNYCSIGISAKIAGFRDKEIESRMSIPKSLAMTNPEYPIELSGNYRVNPLLKSLSYMNDSGKSFPEIADWITENVNFI